ncbi:MAG: UvrB/UvrC motif-containing protein, partial [Candidatus Omnitrophica bacterium]|nr:UvrB/UvrC motif-containing protein [Candidatus Omnitrophota bacterium]
FRTKIKELRKRLERAIGIEEYEEAASLRDEIRKLEKRDV